MYNAYFQFHEAPFGVTPDPHFYYTNAVYREAWATLRYGIQGRKGFIVVSGEAGTGKTTLLRKALHELPRNIKTAYIANALVDFSELLRLVLKELGLVPAESKYDQMEQLNQYLLQQFNRGNIVALLIDEAQDLTVQCLEELRLLGNLETDKHKLLQIVLVGQPGLERKLNEPELVQLKQRVALLCRLRPVETGEIGSYIETRLQTAGRSSTDLFDVECIGKIAFYSKGFPRRINIICDNALLIAYAMSKSKITAAIIDEVAADIMIGESRIDSEGSLGKPTKPLPLEEKASLEHAPREKDAATRREDLRSAFTTFGRNTHFSIPSITLLAIVLLLGVASSLPYAQKFPFFDLNSPSKVAVSTAGGRDQTDRTNLAANAFEQKFLRVNPPPQSHLEMVSNSEQDVAAAGLGEKANAPTSRNKLPTLTGSDPKSEPAPRKASAKQGSSKGKFFVVEPSLVRSKPTSNAEIVATLQPGTIINVTDRTGDYYRVRSLDTEAIRGYVHEQDAFFERH